MRDRLLLFAGRTAQALGRLRYDVEPLFAADSRLRIVYALIPGSRFGSGAAGFADRNGIDLLPWDDAAALGPDLIVTSSPDPCLYEAGAPVVSLPHGAGHNRLRPELSGVSGLSPEQIRGPRGEVPDFLALPGPAAARRLAVDCPEALPHAEVCGDLCFERLRAGVAHRSAYREALGVAPGRRLVVLSSTWDRSALSSRSRTLPERLLDELPMDEFALAYLPHPNDELADAPRPTGFLHPHLANGLIMVPPDEGWRAALVAADCLIGDHGSVTFFGAAIGVPTLLAAFGFAHMPPELPLARFGRSAPRFDHAAPAAPQLRRSIADGALAFDFSEALAEPEPGPSARLSAVVHGLLGSTPLKLVAPQPIPVPAMVPEHGRATSWRFSPRPDGSWDRYPVSVPAGSSDRREGHLVADLATRDGRLKAAANVLLHHRDAVGDAAVVARRILAEFPVCRVASVAERSASTAAAVIATRDGRLLRVRAERGQLDLIPSVLLSLLDEQSTDPVGVGTAEAIEHLQGRFEPAPTVRAVEEEA
ncbi:hypothetical protein [Glycomyces harbinensis]|uniref:Uncharacterized protein n=1 Tax=Glycomyces harbinensis TaxID=58114 RepID=A0A1G6V6F7_9ACTN|nr:hypothetical protein [Glycomyces harbinensis]SDD48587.1 hypothetical protein SAMN05216270_104202 [Glycomyces harbinensis]